MAKNQFLNWVKFKNAISRKIFFDLFDFTSFFFAWNFLNFLTRCVAWHCGYLLPGFWVFVPSLATYYYYYITIQYTWTNTGKGGLEICGHGPGSAVFVAFYSCLSKWYWLYTT